MNDRERFNTVLNYEPYDRLPCIHLGYWPETIEKFIREGRIPERFRGCNKAPAGRRCPELQELDERIGFDYNLMNCLVRDKTRSVVSTLYPRFEEKILERRPDGSYLKMSHYGVIEMLKEGLTSINVEVDHLLKDRQSWEALFKPRLQPDPDRFEPEFVDWFLKEDAAWDKPVGLFAGSLYGQVRDMVGLVELAYLQVDDEDLFNEILAEVGKSSYAMTEWWLKTGINFDFIHFWEDISYKNGPLVDPRLLRAKVGPNYRRVTELARKYGVRFASVDSDGDTALLEPVWLENGVNVMTPIEVGTWDGSYAKIRARNGQGMRGIGGVRKHVLAENRAAVDAEIERLRPIVELGGYIPMLDHVMPPDTEWDLLLYYVDRFRRTFG